MRALVYHNNTLTLDHHYPQPEPIEGEALIRVLQAGICNTDLEITRGYMAFEGVLGHEFVGVVESVSEGSGATPLTSLIGKRVVGEINGACHRSDCFYCQHDMPTQCSNRTTLGIVGRDGAFAEYLTLPTRNLHVVPDNVSDEEAVFVEPLAANFEIFEQVHVRPTNSVIVLGDGKMGQLAAQVLALASCDVLMIGKHPEKLALAGQRGIATHLLDDAEKLVQKAGRRVDLVVECSGSAQGLELALQLARPRGTVILKNILSNSREF